MSWLPTVAHLAGKHLQVFFEPGSWPTMLSHFSRSEVNSGSADGVVKALETHRLAHRLQLHRMADGIEQKLNMSLDDLANQKRQEDLQIHRRSGSQRRHGRSNGLNRAGGYGHQQRPMPGPAHGAPDRAYVGQRLDALMWPAVPMRPQHGWQSGGRGHCGTQRPSVFSRLTELPQQTYHQLPQQFEPVPQQQYVQYADKQPPMSGQPQQLQRSMQPRASPQPNLAAINLQCRLDQATGLVIIQHSGTDIVKVSNCAYSGQHQVTIIYLRFSIHFFFQHCNAAATAAVRMKFEAYICGYCSLSSNKVKCPEGGCSERAAQ